MKIIKRYLNQRSRRHLITKERNTNIRRYRRRSTTREKLRNILKSWYLHSAIWLSPYLTRTLDILKKEEVKAELEIKEEVQNNSDRAWALGSFEKTGFITQPRNGFL